MASIDLGKWQMIMRGPSGDEYAIADGHLPATMVPHHDDDGQVVVTVELAQFVRSLGDEIEALALDGQIPDMTLTCDATDVYSPSRDGSPS